MPEIRIRFWGTRGSLPVAPSAQQTQDKIAQALVAANGQHPTTIEEARKIVAALPFHLSSTFGGNTSCVELSADGNRRILLDMGSGARQAGHAALQQLAGKPGEYHVFMSHPHWDHIMGFPFFTPAYIPGNKIFIYGCHDTLEHAFRLQQSEPCFPVDFSVLGAHIEFIQLETDRTYEIAGYQVMAKLQAHGGDSYGYRFERNGKSVIYSTDSEHKLENITQTQAVIDFFKQADVVIFDAMYALADAVSIKEDWGHSSNVIGVELCQLAQAKHLVLFHHEPVHSDETIATIWHETERLEEITRQDHVVKITAAYDGLEITL